MSLGTKVWKATLEEIEEGKQLTFCKFVGSLMYLSVTSRPDIMYAVEKLVRQRSGYSSSHWALAKTAVRCGTRTKNYCLDYGTSYVDSIGYTEADIGRDKETRYFQFGSGVYRASACS